MTGRSELTGPILSARIAEGLARLGGLMRLDDPAQPVLDDGRRCIPLKSLAIQSFVAAPRAALAGRSLLLLTKSPLSAVLALASLDGLAARLVIAPPDVRPEHLPVVAADAAIDAVIHDGEAPALPLPAFAITEAAEGAAERGALATEWVMFTSGTTGAPKLAAHSLAGLTHAMAGAQPTPGETVVNETVIWATFYDIRRYGGMQMLLRALTGGRTMLLAAPCEPVATFLRRLAEGGATHISGTPSHWRSALMHDAAARLAPRYVRLSGEIADQALLDRLAAAFPGARVGHAYASTEAGVGFEVTDGLEGFPAGFLTRPGPVEMRLRDQVLHVRSPRTASRYLGAGAPPMADAEGFVDTGDLIEPLGERLYFRGRVSGVINVGGLKVHPEEVEAVINRCPGVRAALVKARRNPVLGAVVAAEVVLSDPAEGQGEAARAMRAAILDRCRAELAEYKAPASVKFVDALAMTAGGKLERRHA